MSPSRSERFRVFDVATWSLDADVTLVWNRETGQKLHLSDTHRRLLDACDSFRTLRDHATAFATRHLDESPSPDAVSLLERQLTVWADADLLVSESDLSRRLADTAAPTPADASVTQIAIPSRNRPDLLRRMVRSYAANARAHDRTPDFIVADDGRGDVERAPTQAALRALSDAYDGTIRCITRDDRRSYARTLAERAGVPEATATFALLGSDAFSKTYGATRNALLLDGVGTLQVQADDDTVCDVSVVDSGDPALTVTEGLSDTELWFFDDLDSARAAFSTVDVDFLATHERTLGRSLGDVAATWRDAGRPVDVDGLSPGVLRRADDEDLRVALTQYGSVGDSGYSRHNNLFRLMIESPSHERLVPTNRYRERVNTRYVRRSTTRLNVGSTYPCVAMNVGLDGRALLPPFPPVQRNEDGIFSILFTLCCPSLCGAHLPEAIVHAPPGRRSHADRITDDTMADFFVRTGDLLERLLKRVGAKAEGGTTAERLTSIGRALERVASETPPRFRRILERETLNAIKQHLDHAQSLLDTHSESPAPWKDDVRALIQTLKETTLDPDVCLPRDVEGTPEEKTRRIQHLTQRWASLLRQWPTLVDAARTLRSEGVRLSHVVEPDGETASAGRDSPPT